MLAHAGDNAAIGQYGLLERVPCFAISSSCQVVLAGDYEESQSSSLDHFLANGGSIFGSEVRAAQEDVDKSEELFKLIKAELDATVASSSAQEPAKSSTFYYWPGTQIDKKTGHIDTAKAGLAALQFKRWSTVPGQSVEVLVFRGSRGSGDNHNIMNWIHDFVTNSGMTTRMKEVWKDEAKLEWTSEMDGRSKMPTFFESALSCIVHNVVAGRHEH